MKKATKLILMLCLIFSGALSYAHGKTMAQNKYTFLILLFFLTAFLSKAQEPLEMELIGDSRGYIAMLSLNEDEVLVLTRGEENGT